MDRGRAEVYAAELAAFDGTDLETVRPVAAIIALIDATVADDWWPHSGVRAAAMRSDAESSCARIVDGCVEIRIAAPQATWATAAHELAHALAGVAAGHGPLYRRAMLDVIGVVTNTIGERRGRLHIDQLTDSYAASNLPVADREWSTPTAADPFAL